MKFTPMILAAAAALATAAPASAVEKTYAATLSGAAEAPANASPGTGSVLVTVDTTSFLMHVQASFASLLAPNTAAHIHCCTAVPGVGTAGVATVTPTFTGFPGGTTSGSYDRLFDMTLASSWNPAFVTAHGGTTAAAFADLVAGFDSGSTYFNVHTTAFPGGEIRGFLTAVPEPSSYALMLAGLGAVGLVRRRVSRR